MTLYDLGIQYLTQSEMLFNKAHRLKEKAYAFKGRSAEEINAKTVTLFSMAIECRRTGEYLIDYYGQR